MPGAYKERGRWTAWWKDSTGKRRYARRLLSKSLAREIAERNEYRQQAAAYGVITKDQEKHAREAERGLETHLKDFCDWLRAQKRTEKYIGGVEHDIRRLFKFAGIIALNQVERTRIVTALHKLPPERAVKGEKLSHARRNRILAACKVFMNWLAFEAQRTPGNPLAKMKGLDEEQDRRRVRVIVGGETMVRLIEKTATQPVRGGMTGMDRMIRYALGFGTGFRQGTLFGLNLEDFHLDNEPPFIRVIPTNVKNRKPKDQTISRELAEMLRPWLKGKAKGKPVFSKLPHADTVKAWKRDLKAAGIDYQLDDTHFFDQHAQRNSYITDVIRVAGLKVAQDLAGHSTPVLTSKYARLGMDDYSGAVEKLPSLKRKPEVRKERTA